MLTFEEPDPSSKIKDHLTTNYHKQSKHPVTFSSQRMRRIIYLNRGKHIIVLRTKPCFSSAQRNARLRLIMSVWSVLFSRFNEWFLAFFSENVAAFHRPDFLFGHNREQSQIYVLKPTDHPLSTCPRGLWALENQDHLIADFFSPIVQTVDKMDFTRGSFL